MPQEKHQSHHTYEESVYGWELDNSSTELVVPTRHNPSERYMVAHHCFRRRAAMRDSAEAQPASNGWPGLSMSMTTGA